MNLSIKYRPATFGQVVGHPRIVKELLERSRNDDFPQTILISGPSGVGKTTFSYILAKTIVCQNKKDGEPCNECSLCQDVNGEQFTRAVRFRNASNLGIDEMRAIEEDSRIYDLTGARRKVFIIDELQEMVSNQKAMKNVLSLVEHKHNKEVFFIFLTMDAAKIPTALVDRSVVYRLPLLDTQYIADDLRRICKEEGVSLTKDRVEILLTIAENSRGSLRNALRVLDRVVYSDLWEAKAFEEEIGFSSDADTARLVSYIMTNNSALFDTYISLDTFTRIREYMTAMIKAGLTGKHNPRIKKDYPVQKVFSRLKILNRAALYPYADQLLVDSLLLEAYSLKD